MSNQAMIEPDDLQIITENAALNRLSYREDIEMLILGPARREPVRHLKAVAKAAALLQRYITILLEVRKYVACLNDKARIILDVNIFMVAAPMQRYITILLKVKKYAACLNDEAKILSDVNIFSA